MSEPLETEFLTLDDVLELHAEMISAIGGSYLGLPSGMGEDDSPIALCDIGAVYAERGDIEGAIAAFRLSSHFRFSTSAAYGLGTGFVPQW